MGQYGSKRTFKFCTLQKALKLVTFEMVIFCITSFLTIPVSGSSVLQHIITIFYKAKNDVYAFGYNSAESERIWMKSGALRVHCWGPGRFWARSEQ